MSEHEPIHLRPTAELADRVLLPGDPGRALMLAQSLLDKPLMFNHHRGLWGYTGTAGDGGLLTIQSTGMGGPSAAIVLQELVMLGARQAIRVGTCGALDGGLGLGELVVAGEALADDGTSRRLGAGERVAADEQLTAALARMAERAATERAADTADDTAQLVTEPTAQHAAEKRATTDAAGDTAQLVTKPTAQRTMEPAARHATEPAAGATVASTDLFYEPGHDRKRERAWLAAGAVAVEMEAATLFALGAQLGVGVGCVLVVSDLLGGGVRERIDDETLLDAAGRMGEVAVAALTGA